jgi:hypothetical protein
MSNKNTFLQHLDNLYLNLSIYRAIIITNDDTDSFTIYKDMTLSEHNAVIIKDIINKNYNDSDYRVFIITKENLNNFINVIDDKSYNFVGISYNINEDIADNITTFFSTKNTAILNYKNYATFLLS